MTDNIILDDIFEYDCDDDYEEQEDKLVEPVSIKRLKEIIENPTHNLKLYDALRIFYSKLNKQQKIIFTQNLVENSKDFNNEYAGIYYRFFYIECTYHDSIEEIENIQKQMAKGNYISSYYACTTEIFLFMKRYGMMKENTREIFVLFALWIYNFFTKDLADLSYSLMRKFIEDDNHKRQFDSMEFMKGILLKNKCHPKMIEIMKNFHHPHNLDVALLFFNDIFSSVIKCPCRTVNSSLVNLCCCFCCSPCYVLCYLPYKFYNCFNPYKRSHFFLCCNIINSALTRNDEDAFKAAKFVVGKTIHERNLDRDKAYQCLERICQIEGHKNQLEAINLLRESNDINHQTLGSEMKECYFPQQLSTATTLRKEQFNFEVIRHYMPQPLEDLKDVKMDLTKEFEDLMNLISDQEKINGQDNPYYLSPQSIEPESGSNNPLFYSSLKSRVIGFIKTLEGKKLGITETTGWQMYDEDKPEMINTLKHIVINVKDEIQRDPQNGLISFGIVLNSLLYCPTGQSEGIESAANLIVRRKNAKSTDLKEKIGKFVISSAITKSFNNCFHENGGTHALSRARTVLQEELGSSAISSFKEKISPATVSEIPEIMNTFYRVFCIEAIIKEMRRNVQTKEEYEIIVSSHDRTKIESIKNEKPINVGEIIRWLHDNNEEMVGISEDYTEISELGIVNLLIKLGFLNETPKLLKLMEKMRLKNK